MRIMNNAVHKARRKCGRRRSDVTEREDTNAISRSFFAIQEKIKIRKLWRKTYIVRYLHFASTNAPLDPSSRARVVVSRSVESVSKPIKTYGKDRFSTVPVLRNRNRERGGLLE